jgi:short subunit dehydrogenase-like uncharacterized protein
MRDGRELDLVLLGATGFVGRLTAAYLSGQAPSGLRVGLAGRSRRRLEQVRDGLGPDAQAWPLIETDSTDEQGARTLAGAAGTVVSTVGPYHRLGLPLVRACAEAGTDYADLTGEVLFMKDTIAGCHETAAGTGARIVHSCGFDSTPSDLGVLLAHEAAAADGAGDLTDTTMAVTALRGGLSGGTLASMMEQFDETRTSAGHRRAVADPYALSPDRAAEPTFGAEPDVFVPRYDPDLGQWTGPFLMAGVNTRVVRRSNALLGWAYGRRFRYREVSGFGPGPGGAVRAAAATAGLGALAGGMALPPARALLASVLPKPGEGPSEKTRRNGLFRVEVHARTSGGARYVTEVGAKGDPGYAATVVMLGETGLCLALDRDRLPDREGVLTPATAMGAVLAGRLRAAGHTYRARRLGLA